MKQFKHKNHDHYKKSQISRNRDKSTNVWIRENELRDLARLIKTIRGDQLQFGICHGVRTGTENRVLSEILGIEVVGTDLVGKDGVMEMDFHDEAPQWSGKADFIYTNSLDHSYNPNLALRRWIKCLRPGGIILIHWDRGDEIAKPDAADCFKASEAEYMAMLETYGSVETERTTRFKPKKNITIEIVLFTLRPNP